MNPDPAEIFDIQHIGDTLSDARAWDALRKKDRAWWFAFKQLVKHYILLTNFYDTVPPLASGTERVTAKLDALMPPPLRCTHLLPRDQEDHLHLRRCRARTACGHEALLRWLGRAGRAQVSRLGGGRPVTVRLCAPPVIVPGAGRLRSSLRLT